MGTTARRLPLLFALFFILTLSPVWADGNQLLENCQKWETETKDLVEAAQSGMCMGMVQGVTDEILFMNPSMPKNLQVCLPEKITSGQIIKIVIKYLKDNPEQLHLSEAQFIHGVLLTTYPCK